MQYKVNAMHIINSLDIALCFVISKTKYAVHAIDLLIHESEKLLLQKIQVILNKIYFMEKIIAKVWCFGENMA